MPDYKPKPAALARLRRTALPVARSLGGDVTARQFATAMGWSLNHAKRVLQVFRATGELPAYVPPPTAKRPRVRPAPTDAQLEATREYKRQWRRRQALATLAARPGGAGAAWTDPREKGDEDYRPDIAAETAKIQAGWTDAQRARRDARPAPEWQVPGVRGDRRWRREFVDHAV